MREGKKLNPKDEYGRALTEFGEAMKEYRKEDFQKASEKLKAFIKNYPKERDLVNRAKLYLSICQEKQKKKKLSLKTFDDHYHYSLFKLNQGEFEEALKHLDKAQQMKPKQGKVFYLKALVNVLMERKEKSLENLKKAVQLDKFFKILAKNEVDFEPLKEDKKFNLITKVE
ncbi:hypothetical protein KGY73_04820 [bacterium]|nr:hypothetical protein [bacterium]